MVQVRTLSRIIFIDIFAAQTVTFPDGTTPAALPSGMTPSNGTTDHFDVVFMQWAYDLDTPGATSLATNNGTSVLSLRVTPQVAGSNFTFSFQLAANDDAHGTFCAYRSSPASSWASDRTCSVTRTNGNNVTVTTSHLTEFTLYKSSSQSSDPNSTRAPGSQPLGAGAIAGIVIGVLVAVFAVIAVVVFFVVKRKRNAEASIEMQTHTNG